MKNIIILFAFQILSFSIFAQTNSDTSLYEKTIKEKILNDIKSGLESKTSAIDSTIRHIDLKVDKLDSMISTTTNAKEKADKLLERVQVVEDKQKAMEENELNIYQANYQSALINLFSMDREIKPLTLFNATRNFFTELSQVSNPDTYNGYQEWFKYFRIYIEKNKESDIYLKTLDNMINVTQTAASVSLITSGASQVVLSGMSNYINTISRKQKDLREQSIKMFQITIVLSQFENDRIKIENNWESFAASLENLQILYNSYLTKNLKIINVEEKLFTQNFTAENDADKRYLYLTALRKLASDAVVNFKKANPKDWKEYVYYEMVSIRDLKMKFGELLTEMNLYADQYGKLIAKYKKDPNMGPKMEVLESKLNILKATFDKNFQPQDYIQSAFRMYKVF
jgi:hypothetical protein